MKIWNEKGKSCLHVSSGLCCIKMQGQIKDYDFILNSMRWTNYRSWFYFCEVICESQNLYCLSTSIFWLNGQVIVLRKSIPHPIWKAGIIQNFLNIPMINLKVPEPRHEVQWFWNNIFKTIVKCRIWKKNTIKQLKAYMKSLLRMRNIPRLENGYSNFQCFVLKPLLWENKWQCIWQPRFKIRNWMFKYLWGVEVPKFKTVILCWDLVIWL